MSIYGESSEGMAAQASAGAKTAGPLVQLQAKWGELDDKQRNIAVVAALILLAVVGYSMMGPSGPDTWNGAAVSINADGSQCVSGTAEGFGATSVSTSSGMSSEGSCGPCMVPNAGISTKVHCNRDYTFGAGYQSFFTEYAGRELTLIQDTHDPNDIKWTRTGVVDQETGHSSTQFATVTIPAGAEATFHCFVPIGCQEDHAHTKNEYPNYVDPLGGWTESSESYMEDNGIERKRFFKKVTAADAPLQYPLHHTTHKGWGYVYLVELQKAGYCPVHTPPANKITVTDLHAGHACGPLLVPYPSSCTEVHCDRHYKFGNWEKGNQLGYRNWNSFFVPSNDNTRRRNLWLIQDSHDPNDVADLTSQVDATTGLIDPLSARSVTTCQGGLAACKFVRVHIPNGYTATIHAFVPLEASCRVAAPPPPAQSCDAQVAMCRADLTCNNLMQQYSGLGGMSYVPEFQCVPNAACNALTQCRQQRSAATGEQHAHTQADMPNMIDKYPQGWNDMNACYSEDPGYKLTEGYCRGGPAWEVGHAGAPDLWDCSPSGGMDGGTLIENSRGGGQGLSKNQCQEACDRDYECGAFDTESHTASGLTLSECCLFKAENKGNGSPERHCWIKGLGENADTSIRPRGHWTKSITPSTTGVITEANMDGVGEATGVNAVHKAGHYAYDLYHTVHTGWGYVYIVELCGGPDGNSCQTTNYGR